VLPTDLVSWIVVEWMHAGGIGLYRKEIQAFNTYLPFVIFYLYNGTLVQIILAEICRLMEEGVKLLVEEVMGDKRVILVAPPFAFWKLLPKLPSQDPSEYSGLTPRQVATRRAWHLEMETQHVSEFAKMIEKCKEFAMFEDFWGSHVVISATVDYDSPPGDISRILLTAKLNMCFHMSMTSAQLYGIIDLDKVVPYTIDEDRKESGFLCMQQVLSKHFHTRDGTSPLFTEVHQKQSGLPVDAVVPNVKEVDAMISSMNRQLVAFIKHYLLLKGLDQGFVVRLVVAACCPTLVGNMNTVTWDDKKMELITPEDAKDKDRLSAFANTPWYFDIKKLQVSPTKSKKNYTAPEALFNLDANRLIVTLHAKNNAKCAADRHGQSNSDSEEEGLDSASNERELDKSPDDKATNKDKGPGHKSISWSPSGSSDERLASQEAAGSG
jgi:hypothetical protein